jgi:hypothetical protein
MHPRVFILGAALCAATFDAGASCGAAFCLVNTDWSAQGAWTEGGARFDLRYETIDLDRPRAGRDRVDVGSIPRDHDEVDTRNRNVVAGVDLDLGRLWGLSISIPYVDRNHLHLHHREDGEIEEERWNFRGAGDVRVQARYVLTANDDPQLPCSAGFSFGLKLPTGRHDVANAEGEVAERTLQPGSGTTDAIVGMYWSKAQPLTGWSYFTRAQAVVPIDSRDGFKPGRQLQADVGARYAVNSTLGLMIQANFQAKGRDSGANAEPEDSGQRAAYLSPGISWNPSRNAQVYAFVQVPVYQSVNGVQLTADWSAVAGVSWRF